MFQIIVVNIEVFHTVSVRNENIGINAEIDGEMMLLLSISLTCSLTTSLSEYNIILYLRILFSWEAVSLIGEWIP